MIETETDSHHSHAKISHVHSLLNVQADVGNIITYVQRVIDRSIKQLLALSRGRRFELQKYRRVSTPA